MLQIALCDDMQKDIDKVMAALSHIEEKWKDDFQITTFTSGETLCSAIRTSKFNIILLDILMDDLDGIETALRIRAMQNDTLIIFISSYDERVKDLFDVQTIAFLDKPLITEKLEMALLKAYKIINRYKERIFTYKKGRSMQYVNINEIIYIESKRNTVHLYTTSFEDVFYDTLLNIWSCLQNAEEFIMPHRSFIFNLKYVILKSDAVILKETMQEFMIGAKFQAETEKRYLHYIRKRCI